MVLVAMTGCARESAWKANEAASADPDALEQRSPVARANWTIARAGEEVYAFYGLGPGKTHADIARDVHAYNLRTRKWRVAAEIPVAEGRLASVAITIGGDIYLFGGYTVSPAGEEASTPEVLRFDPETDRFERETTMPTPVDDSIALPGRDRWIILVSGWHDTGNVADVQVYDTRTKAWTSGTPWPGAPVFGHAGGVVGDVLVACDGVTAVKGEDGRNRFSLTDSCWRGELDADKVGRIRWQALPPHPGAALYRAGAVGTRDGNAVVFAGGSTRAYNYDGIGYDGVPAEPSAMVVSYDLRCNAWRTPPPLVAAAMDFRGLIEDRGRFLLFAGMRRGQTVSADVIRFEVPSGIAPTCE